MIPEREVDQPPLAGRHGRERIRHSGLDHTLRGHLGGQPEFLLAGGAVAFAIEADLIVIFRVEMKGLMGEVLKCAQRFGATFQQQRAVRAGEFHQDLWSLQFLSGGGGRVDGDAVLQLERA